MCIPICICITQVEIAAYHVCTSIEPKQISAIPLAYDNAGMNKMESLEDNLFFKALTTTYVKRYHEVIDNCYDVCVPVNGSYDPRQLNDKFITTHILKPSPLLKSHLLPYNNKQNFNIQIDKGLIKITKGLGNHNVNKIAIISEEKAYNNMNNSYRILICESPLISSWNCKLNFEIKSFAPQDIELVSFEDCEKFLRKLSAQELDRLKGKISELMKTYIILPEYIEDVAHRLQNIIDMFIQSFELPFCKLNQYRHNRDFLASTIESYSIGLIYDRLMPLIKDKYAKEDEAFKKLVQQIKHHALKPTDFGAQKVFQDLIITKEIVATLMEIENVFTPLAKLNKMRSTLNVINEHLKKTVDDHRSPFEKKHTTIYIMSDDLIAAIICLLANCEPSHFCSNIRFIHLFSWYLPQNSELGYSLVTFEVAKEYILNYQHPSNHKDDSKSVVASNSPNYRPKITLSKPRDVYSNFDQEIDKISQMLDNTQMDEMRLGNSSATSNSSEELGGFLGSLTNDYFTLSGQKF